MECEESYQTCLFAANVKHGKCNYEAYDAKKECEELFTEKMCQKQYDEDLKQCSDAAVIRNKICEHALEECVLESQDGIPDGPPDPFGD